VVGGRLKRRVTVKMEGSKMARQIPQVIVSYPERCFSAWNQRDLAVVEKILAPSFSWIDPSLPAELTEYEGARGFFAASWQGFPDIAFEAISEPLVDLQGGRVACEWRMTGTHVGEGFPPGIPPTGKAFNLDGTDVFTVADDGRATAIRAYYDSATLLRQLGLA
jgi:steroid delta-isomerase-like uncharacterized protein